MSRDHAGRTVRTLSGLALVALVLSGCAVNEQGDAYSPLDGRIVSAGSSAQSSAQEVWIAAFQRDNSRVTIDYEPSGSGAGREQFIAGGLTFAGSDAPLSEEELENDFVTCAPGAKGIDLPVYVSPLALVFSIDGVDELRLDASTIARIFANEITTWDDPAIAALNPDAALPTAPVTAVHRSDSSGTTKNFTDYLHQNVPEIWPHEPEDEFPVSGGEAAQGNSGVVGAVSGGNNIIGYVDASRAGDLDAASLQVGDAFVDFSPEAAAAIIDASPLVERSNPHDIVVDIDRTSTAEGVYPLVLVSYLIACEEYADANDAEIVKAYFGYIASDEGQAESAMAAGSAPLSAEFSARITAAIDSIR